MTPDQCRAARALLNWSQPVLVEKSGLSIATVKRFESGQAPVSEEAVQAMKDTLKRAGVNFISLGEQSLSGEEGVRLSSKTAGGR